MLEFDFRNGPIRRKYDGLKYALKTIEDIVYEISLVEDKPFPSSVTGVWFVVVYCIIMVWNLLVFFFLYVDM